MIFITSSGEFSCIYIFLVFLVCLILFNFILFLSNFTPFGRVVFFLVRCLLCSCCRGSCSSGIEFLNQG